MYPASLAREQQKRNKRKEPELGAAAVPIVLVFLLVFLSWRIVFSANRDLMRAKAWGPLLRRASPFIVLTLMALSLFVVQNYRTEWLLTAWAALFAGAVIASNLLSMPGPERRANKAFRKGAYDEASSEYRKLVEEQPLARHKAFLGAALGAGGHNEEALEISTEAIEQDPKYGIAYYNRALILRRMNRKSRAVKDLKRSMEADLPRRFRGNAKGLLDELKK